MMVTLAALALAAEPITFNNVTIHCWHIHVYFLERNNASASHAIRLRSEFLKRFVAAGAPTCEAEVTTDRTCVWPGINTHPTGPHTFGSWGASMPNDAYNSVVPWVIASAQQPRTEPAGGGDLTCQAQRGALAGVLVHPLTAPRGADTRASRRLDHELGLWAGKVRGGTISPPAVHSRLANSVHFSFAPRRSCRSISIFSGIISTTATVAIPSSARRPVENTTSMPPHVPRRSSAPQLRRFRVSVFVLSNNF